METVLRVVGSPLFQLYTGAMLGVCVWKVFQSSEGFLQQEDRVSVEPSLSDTSIDTQRNWPRAIAAILDKALGARLVSFRSLIRSIAIFYFDLMLSMNIGSRLYETPLLTFSWFDLVTMPLLAALHNIPAIFAMRLREAWLLAVVMPVLFPSLGVWLYAATGYLVSLARTLGAGVGRFGWRFTEAPQHVMGIVAGGFVAIAYWAVAASVHMQHLMSR